MYNCPRAATVRAKTADCVLWALDRDTFQHVVSSGTASKASGREGFLRSIDLFKTLSKQELAAVADALEELTLLPGEDVIREGDTSDFLCIVEKGQCVATIAGKEVASYSSGEFFGELAMLNNAPRAATVTAKGSGETKTGGADGEEEEETIVCVTLGREEFERLLGSCADVLKRNVTLYKKYEGAIAVGEAEAKAARQASEGLSDGETDEEDDLADDVGGGGARRPPAAAGRGRKKGISAEAFGGGGDEPYVKKVIAKDSVASARIRSAVEGTLLSLSLSVCPVASTHSSLR
jgi:cAMP-dependent protein kinase regulator